MNSKHERILMHKIRNKTIVDIWKSNGRMPDNISYLTVDLCTGTHLPNVFQEIKDEDVNIICNKVKGMKFKDAKKYIYETDFAEIKTIELLTRRTNE